MAHAGRGADGRGYVHILSKRSKTEVVVTEGTAHIRCKECYRWTNIKIVNAADGKAETDPMPESVQDAISASW